VLAQRGNPWCYYSIILTAALQVFLTYTPGGCAVRDVLDLNGFQHSAHAGCVGWPTALTKLQSLYISS